MSFPAREDLIDFVYDEAHMLDEGLYEEWLALWAPDSYYWMPLEYKQTDPKLVTSLLYEDEFLRKMRVHRLRGCADVFATAAQPLQSCAQSPARS